MNSRNTSILLLSISVVLLLLMLIPSKYDYGWWINGVVVVMNTLILLGILCTVFIILWIIHKDAYDNISIARVCVLLTTLLCTMLVFMFALIDDSISIKFVLIDFVLILSTSIDFVVEITQKVLQYNKSKMIAKDK